MHRSEGIQEREAYLKQQQEKTDSHLSKIQKALKDNPKVKRKELAELLGVSVFRVDQLKRELKSL
jgi:Mn-dependent DtxR family transcriptional regulator